MLMTDSPRSWLQAEYRTEFKDGIRKILGVLQPTSGGDYHLQKMQAAGQLRHRLHMPPI